MRFEDIFIADKRARELTAEARRRYDDAVREADESEKRVMEDALRRAERDAAAERRASRREQTGGSEAPSDYSRELGRIAVLERENTGHWADEIYDRIVTGL